MPSTRKAAMITMNISHMTAYPDRLSYNERHYDISVPRMWMKPERRETEVKLYTHIVWPAMCSCLLLAIVLGCGSETPPPRITEQAKSMAANGIMDEPAVTAAAVTEAAAPASESGEAAKRSYSPKVKRYLEQIYDVSHREFACTATNAAAHAEWRSEARPVLRRLLGLDHMQEELAGWTPMVELSKAKSMDGYTRARGKMLVEPNVTVPFWVLRPQGSGPFPVAVMPHGHDPHGWYANIYDTEEDRSRIASEDRDVAVQAVRRGYIAIAPATRGLGCAGVPDIDGRHGKRDCRSQMVHCLLAGRTPLGERVWDMERFLDWGLALPNVDSERVLMLGNSGGGVVAVFAAACDERITVAVPSCSFSSFIRNDGTVQFCDCNLVPSILRFGDAHDIAGLIAPRWLLAVHGEKDGMFYMEDIEGAAARTRAVFAAAGVPTHFELRVGPHGHRFYKELMWPFIDVTLGSR